MKLLESRMTRKCHVRFGGGPGEKEPCYLACGLPYDTYTMETATGLSQGEAFRDKGSSSQVDARHQVS
jgi:hypothetical protein